VPVSGLLPAQLRGQPGWAADVHGERRAALAAGLQVPGVVPAGVPARLHRGSTRQASEDRPAVAGGTGQDGQVSGGKRDAEDAHVLADMVRTDSHQRGPPTWGGHAGDDRVAFIDTRDVADVAAPSSSRARGSQTPSG
jgi:hypothetical protein